MSINEIINLSYIAKAYYDFIIETGVDSDKTKVFLFDLSLKYVKSKEYESISPGYKERCMYILFHTLETSCDSDIFYQKVLTYASCCDIIIQNLHTILEDMLMYCQDTMKKMS